MVFPKARLVTAAALFLAWIGFLAYLVARTRDPVILSRPQLLVSNLIVRAEVKDGHGRPAPTIAVKDVLRAVDADDRKLIGQEIDVPDIVDCLAAQGWREAGEYIVPLTKSLQNKQSIYHVTPLPIVPGFTSKYVSVELLSVGPNPQEVAKILKDSLDVDAGPLDGKKGKQDSVLPWIARRNVPHSEKARLEQALKHAGAAALFPEAETRIYRATADAMAQWREIDAGH
ncbi:MAG: hypothetical protein HY040_18760 [Planctomycetes bacterium]|nr:hypothetical protein [Planctomycetota bacterium]